MQKEKLLFLFHFRVRVSSAKPKLRKVESKTKKLVFFFCRDGELELVRLTCPRISPSLMAELRKNERNAKRKAAFSFPSTEDSILFAWLVQEVRRSQSSFSVSLRKRQSRATESREQNKETCFLFFAETENSNLFAWLVQEICRDFRHHDEAELRHAGVAAPHRALDRGAVLYRYRGVATSLPNRTSSGQTAV